MAQDQKTTELLQHFLQVLSVLCEEITALKVRVEELETKELPHRHGVEKR